MKGKIMGRIVSQKLIKYKLLSIIITVLMLGGGMNNSLAKDTETEVIGKYYEFDSKNDYEFSSDNASVEAVSGNNRMGRFTVAGDFVEEVNQNEIPIYRIKNGFLSLNYSYDTSILHLDETEWHLVDNKSKKVDEITLESNIMKGALILQSSLDGKTWLEDVIVTDMFTEDGMMNDTIYTTKKIQQQNGCYFRVIVVYSLEKKVGEKKLGFIKTDEIEEKNVAEVYEFYVVDEEISDAISATDEPRKELGKKVNAGKDTGYYENNLVDIEDPHFGWDIGTFFVNGYTREMESNDDTPIFLKNVGDKVTLWFRLDQDIDTLNNNKQLSISEDNNGYNKEFEIGQTDFGRGALIIRYTDYQGVVHEPIIYTNYLAANARTGAETRVQLFEEGDYDVCLNYEIKDNPRSIGSVSVLPSYTNYKIRFNFSIRNGNAMVYPFDIETDSELSDNAITENGFRLDMARSRYLTIDMKRSILKESDDGTIIEDIRFNGAVEEDDIYRKDGIYTFTVKNQYTDVETTKTIFVGGNKYSRAISTTGMTLVELNDKIALGATVTEEGAIVEPVEEITETADVNKSDEVETMPEEANEQIDGVTESEKLDEDANSEIPDVETKENVDTNLIASRSTYLAIGVIVLLLILARYVIRNRRK